LRERLKENRKAESGVKRLKVERKAESGKLAESESRE
jgi:hypothetical protein